MLVEESGVECSDYLHDYDQWTLAMCVRKQCQTSVRQYYLQIYRSRFVEKVSGCLLSIASNIIMKYLQTIFFLCLKLHDCLRHSVCVLFVCFELQEHFLDLSWMCGKGHYYIETSGACATGITNDT